MDLIPYTGNTARTGCCETQILVFTKKVGLGRGINLPVLTQYMNVLQVLFPADKLQARASLISLPYWCSQSCQHKQGKSIITTLLPFWQGRHYEQCASNGVGQDVNARLNGCFGIFQTGKSTSNVWYHQNIQVRWAHFWQVITTITLSKLLLSQWTEKFICPSLFWPFILGLSGKTLVARCLLL